MVGLGTLAALLYRFYGPPGLPANVPDFTQVRTILLGPELPVEAVIYLIATLLWIIWAWFALSLVLQMIVAAVETVARGARWVRGLRRFIDIVSPALVQRVAKPVAVGMVALTLARSAAPPTSALASGEAHFVVVQQPERDPESSASRTHPRRHERRDAEHTVRSGDNLWDLAERYYGDGDEFPRIIAENSGHVMRDAEGNRTRFSSVLRPGWVLSIPGVEKSVEERRHGRTYTVEERDTLRRIAARQLGGEERWPEIFALNEGTARDLQGRVLAHPDLIYTGMKLILPPESDAPSTEKEKEGQTDSRVIRPSRPQLPRPRQAHPDQREDERPRHAKPQGSNSDRRVHRQAGVGAGAAVPASATAPAPTETDERPTDNRKTQPTATPTPVLPESGESATSHALRPTPAPSAASAVTPTGTQGRATPQRMGTAISVKASPTAIAPPEGRSEQQPPQQSSSPDSRALAAGAAGAAATVAVAGGGAFLLRRLRTRRDGSARTGELRDDGFMQPESLRRLAQRLHEGDFEPVVAVADRVAAFLAEQGLARLLVLTARQGPEDLHLILSGGLTEEARILNLSDALATALDADVQVHPTRDRDVALSVRLHQAFGTGVSPQSAGRSPLLVAVGAPASRHALYANWKALGNVLVVGSTAGGVDTLLASLLAALISRRSPNELQVRLIADRCRLPQGRVDLPHQIADIVDPDDREAVAAQLEAVSREVAKRAESAASAGADEGPPELVLVVGELADLDIDPAILETISLSGPEHGVRLLAGTTRALEIGRRTLALFNTRLVLRVETEDESVELVGWDEAAGLAGGGDMLLWLAGRATVRLRAFRNEPERLDQLGGLMRETYGSVHEGCDPPITDDDQADDKDKMGGPEIEQGSVIPFNDGPTWKGEFVVVDPVPSPTSSHMDQSPKEWLDVATTPVATLERPIQVNEGQSRLEVEAPTEEPASDLPIRISCFGPFTVTASGRPLSWECSINGENSAFHKEWELLAFVALHGSQGVSADRVAASVWPKSAPHSVLQHSLRPVASRLRTLLQHQAEGIEGNVVLSIKRGVCKLNAELIWSDAQEFLALTQTAGKDRQAALERAVALYRGDPLVDATWAWVYERPTNETLTPHDRFRQAFCGTAVELAELYLAHGRPGDAIPLYRRVLEFDPTLEEPFLKLVECRKRTGQRSELERDGLWVRERIRDWSYDPDDSEDSRDDYDLEPNSLAAWHSVLAQLS